MVNIGEIEEIVMISTRIRIDFLPTEDIIISGKFADAAELFNELETADCTLIGDCAGRDGGLADLIYNALYGCVYRIENIEFERLLRGGTVRLKAYSLDEFGIDPDEL